MAKKNLVIVESPAKAKTIEGYLGADFQVRSSYGHVRDLPDRSLAIDVENGFQPTYEVSPDKAKLIGELRQLAKGAEMVWLATDDDREGEAISWHLKEALKLPDSTRRIVFREITKSAIQRAIEQPRSIDIDLVNAQQARRVLDRLIGYELSPVLWAKVQKGLSAGRVQSVALRLVVERERDIEGFQIKSSYKITAEFLLEGGRKLQAELPRGFASESEAVAFLERCIGAVYRIAGLETKPARKTPAPPFTTSTLQQEASRKLGFSVAATMQYAQKLYEAGKISYMRTDSTNLSEEALSKARAAILSQFGEKFSKERRFKTKNESAQEAHEAIRPTEFTATQAGETRQEQRLYELIWKRAIASQMADAELERTTATISISTTPEQLVAQGEVIKFEGFLKVYLESKDEEDEESRGMLPPLSIGQVLRPEFLKATERFSRPPARFTEASLVKELEERGIGRPSTYAPTISTIIRREYVVKEDRPGQQRNFQELTLQNNAISRKTLSENFGSEKAKLFPTSIGMVVSDFLVGNFKEVVDYQFTAEMENEFDRIAEGRLQWQQMIADFYRPFHATIQTSQQLSRSDGGGIRELGTDPKTGKPVLVRLGKFGPYVQLGESKGEEKPQYANIPKDKRLDTITLQEALQLLNLPRTIGELDGEPMVVSIGKLGPYIKIGDRYVNLSPDDDPYTLTEERALQLIEAKRTAEASDTIGLYENNPITRGKGRFGPYVKHNGKFYSLGRGQTPEGLTLAQAIEIIESKRLAEANKYIREFPENDKVKVLNGRFGPYIQVGKRNVKIPKDKDPASLTLEECLKLAEGSK